MVRVLLTVAFALWLMGFLGLARYETRSQLPVSMRQITQVFDRRRLVDRLADSFWLRLLVPLLVAVTAIVLAR